ncbi:MAG: class I SAM-dependent methyltransferase [Sulfuricurvum sp.]|jgi:SAM-dependent methyltransferase
MSRVDNATFYHAAIAEHGLNARGVHWHSREAQEIRFDQLLALLPSNTRSIVDAGCGFGDFYAYMIEQQRDPMVYVGLDMLEVMVQEASARTLQSIHQCDILNDPLVHGEFYLCSGALNILTRYEAHRFIRRCYDASQRGIIFNFLEGEDTSMTYNYLQLSQIEALGHHLGARMEFRCGYYKNDCTVAFFKDVC